MAKRVAKRETNAQRRAREKERLATYGAASEVAMLMELEIEKLRAGKGDKRRGTEVYGDHPKYFAMERKGFLPLLERGLITLLDDYCASTMRILPSFCAW